MTDIRGATCVVTGAARGLGRAITLALATSGAARLFICDVETDALIETAGAVETSGCQVEHRTLDVSRSNQIEDWAQHIYLAAGPIHILVNNAGVSVIAPLTRLDIGDLEWLMGINFWGMIYSTKCFAPQMIEAGRGHIVNVSSIYGVIAVPGQSAYNAAKFAIRGFTEAIAMELAPLGVKVSIVIPGGIKTDIVKRARFKGTNDPSVTHDMVIERFARTASTTPTEAAARIVAGIKSDARRILIGKDAWLLEFVQRLFPSAYGKFLLPFLNVVPGKEK